MIVFLVGRQGVVVEERKHRECCVVVEEGRQGKPDGTVDCQKVLGEKGRSWTKMTCLIQERRLENAKVCTTRSWEEQGEAARELNGSHHATWFLLEISSLFVLLEYSLGVL